VATSKRLEKDLILVNFFRTVLRWKCASGEVSSACYLFAPHKDSQTGGHRLRPDFLDDNEALGIGWRTISDAVLEATGATKKQYRQHLDALRDAGEAALALRDGGGGQFCLVRWWSLRTAAVSG
jgi:hypothetical protein